MSSQLQQQPANAAAAAADPALPSVVPPALSLSGGGGGSPTASSSPASSTLLSGVHQTMHPQAALPSPQPSNARSPSPHHGPIPTAAVSSTAAASPQPQSPTPMTWMTSPVIGPFRPVGVSAPVATAAATAGEALPGGPSTPLAHGGVLKQQHPMMGTSPAVKQPLFSVNLSGVREISGGAPQVAVGGGAIIGTANALLTADHCQKVFDEFEALSRKANRILVNLRQLPMVGVHWQPYFEQAFLIYSQLWTMQQEQRAALEAKGLKRWHIGELASRIAQIYYHYYLRTSYITCLQEAFNFYHAIKLRSYFGVEPFSGALASPRTTEVLSRNLRYQARFLLVCMLLGCKPSLYSELIMDLKLNAVNYLREVQPPAAEQHQWKSLLKEIQPFSDCTRPILLKEVITAGLAKASSPTPATPISNSPGPASPTPTTTVSICLDLCAASRLDPVYLARMQAFSPVPTRRPDPGTRLKLHSAIIVANKANQIKFSELTIDMLHMLHALEYTPSKSAPNPAASMRTLLPEQGQSDSALQNPQKFLLYRPSLSYLLSNIATVFSDMQPHRAMLLYISADHRAPPDGASGKAGAELFSRGGLGMGHGGGSDGACPGVFTPGDLLPFTRKPLMLVVDSNNPAPFTEALPVGVFGAEPFLCLAAPTKVETLSGTNGSGSGLFSLFMSAPLAALCVMTGRSTVPRDTYDACAEQLTVYFQSLTKALFDAEALIPSCYLRFLEDDFLGSMVLRFLFAHACFSLALKLRVQPPATDFAAASVIPTAHPSLPQAILEGDAVRGGARAILESLLKVPAAAK
eukprot:TRINITY_DN598_c0_g1_i1.p1 TRINITY_DN598_c0_g1~~TRINITY_DN598_c0_g1_i1.p1  ORF type:complete len:805 (+),score=200.08 TRINITY_DN598_c0_g1_i1:88-2502(+)